MLAPGFCPRTPTPLGPVSPILPGEGPGSHTRPTWRLSHPGCMAPRATAAYPYGSEVPYLSLPRAALTPLPIPGSHPGSGWQRMAGDKKGGHQLTPPSPPRLNRGRRRLTSARHTCCSTAPPIGGQEGPVALRMRRRGEVDLATLRGGVIRRWAGSAPGSGCGLIGGRGHGALQTNRGGASPGGRGAPAALARGPG